MTRGLQRLTDLYAHQVYLRLIKKVYSHQLLKLQCGVDDDVGLEHYALHVPFLEKAPRAVAALNAGLGREHVRGEQVLVKGRVECCLGLDKVQVQGALILDV